MNLKKMSDKELLDELCSANNKYIVGIEDAPEYITILDRLARGRKAIEFCNALIKHRDNCIDLEKDGRIYNFIDEYERRLKKATDDK